MAGRGGGVVGHDQDRGGEEEGEEPADRTRQAGTPFWVEWPQKYSTFRKIGNFAKLQLNFAKFFGIFRRILGYFRANFRRMSRNFANCLQTKFC